MPFAPVNGLNLYHEDLGSGAPLMLVAGLGSDSRNWQPAARLLARHRRVIVPDNRGVGRTTPMDAPTSLELMAQDCLALADHLGLDRFDLCGHSMGGEVALACALARPDAVDRLILSGTSARLSTRNRVLFSDWIRLMETGIDPALWLRGVYCWVFARRFFENPSSLDSAVSASLADPHPQSRQAFAAQVRALSDCDLLVRLPEITSRTLIVCGSEDLLIPADESREQLGTIPGSRSVVIPRAGHSIHLENPLDFTARVLEFLGS